MKKKKLIKKPTIESNTRLAANLRPDDALKFKLTLPSLTVGTVGGGTRLKMQRKKK